MQTETLHSRYDILEELASLRPSAGRHRLSLRIGPAELTLHIRDSGLHRTLARHYAAYVKDVPASGARLHLLQPAEFGHGGLTPFVSENPDAEFHLHGRGVRQRDFFAVRTSPHESVALISHETMDAVHNLLRWFLPPLLLEKDAFLLHAGAVVRGGGDLNDRGYVFFGESGAGKSTSVNLITESDPGSTALGDDAVIVALNGRGGLTLYPAPMGCGYSRSAPPNRPAPVESWFELVHADDHRIDTFSSTGGTVSLLAAAMSLDPADAPDRKLRLARRMTEALAPNRLSFRRDAGFWSMILNQEK